MFSSRETANGPSDAGALVKSHGEAVGNRESGAVTELGRRLHPVSLDHHRVVTLRIN